MATMGGAVIESVGAEALRGVPFTCPGKRLGQLLESLAEIDEQPAVRVAVGDLLRLGIEGRLVLIVDDEFWDRPAAGRPGVLEDRREGGTVAVIARGNIDLCLGSELLPDDMGKHLALDVIGGNRFPHERHWPAFVELAQRWVGAACKYQDIVRYAD